MNKSAVRFLYRVLTVVFSLVTFLLADALLLGALSPIGGLALIPAAALATAHVFRLSGVKSCKKTFARSVAVHPSSGKQQVAVRSSLRVIYTQEPRPAA